MLIHIQTQEIITTHMSQSNKGTRAYNAVHSSILASHRTLRCIILQCIEAPLAQETSAIVTRTSTDICDSTGSSTLLANNPPSLHRPGPGLPVISSGPERSGRTSNMAAPHAESSHAPPRNLTATLANLPIQNSDISSANSRPAPHDTSFRPSLAMSAKLKSRRSALLRKPVDQQF
jgi:hypothetical protein